jgi:hypothetical protein
MADYDDEIAAALVAFPPATTPEASQGFAPLIVRPERKVVSVKDYSPAIAPDRKVSDADLAVRLAEDDQAMLGFRLVSHDAATGKAVFEADPALKSQADLRRSYQAYRNAWGTKAAKREINGVPDSAMEFCRKIAAGEPMFPLPDEPPPKDPVQARFEALEAEVKRLTALTPRLPR